MMPTPTTTAAVGAVTDPGRDRGSAQAKSVYEDLLVLPPEVRRPFYREFDSRTMSAVLRVARREGGTEFALWRDDPVGFVEDVIGEATWSKQREILAAIPDNKRIAVPSAFGTGKTHISARAALYRSLVYPVGSSLTVTTATRFRQVARQLWPHIRACVKAAGLPVVADTTQLKATSTDGVLTVVAYGFSAPPHDESAVQGIHCFDDQTELLTDQGWKPFPEVTGEERVLTLDGDTAEWGPITKVWRHDFDGYLNVHDGQRVNFAVTDNHRFLVRSRGHTYKRHSRLTVEDGDRIKAARARGVRAVDLACEYGVSPATISDVACGRRDGRLRTGAPDAPRWSFTPYSDLPEQFIVRRTNTWGGSNPDAVVFEAQEIAAVMCAGCGEPLRGRDPGQWEKALAGGSVYHAACRTLACKVEASCSACGSWFTLPRSQARRARRLYCPGSTCRTGSHPTTDPISRIRTLPSYSSIGTTVDRRSHPRYEFTFEDWADFLGWYVAEGSLNRGTWDIEVSQSRHANPDKHAQIGDLLKRMGIRATAVANGHKFRSEAVGRWLATHCGIGSHNKRIPLLIREATPPMIRRFLDSYAAGDGCAHTHEDSRRYITSSKALADDIHEVLAKIGRARKMRVMTPAGAERTGPRGEQWVQECDMWVVTEAGVPTDSDVLKRNVTRERYTGKVYCVSTPHQSIMVRRRGCPMWSGNSPNLFVVVDEAGGISRTIGKGLRGLMTGDNTRLLAIGNPPTDDEGSWFEGLCGDDDVKTIPITAYDAPLQSGEKTRRCRACPPSMPAHGLGVHLVDQTWIDETIEDYGPDAPYVKAKVHAKFPRGGASRTIPADWVDLCLESPEPDGDDYVRLDGLIDGEQPYPAAKGAWVRLGVDVAADGGDELVISRAVGDLVTVEHFSAGAANANSVDVAGKVLEHIRRAEQVRGVLGTAARVRVKIDGIGVGWGVASTLTAWGSEGIHDAEIVTVVVSEDTYRDDEGATLRPYRKRDEMWLAGRALTQPRRDTGRGVLRLRVDRKTAGQLSAPNYGTNSGGRTVVESKASMKSRGIPSPDRAEATLLATYEPLQQKKGTFRVIA